MGLDNLKRYQHHLHVLRDGTPNLRKALLAQADKELIIALVEICINILNGNLQLPPRVIENLRKYKSTIRALASRGGKSSGVASKNQLGGGSMNKRLSDLNVKRKLLVQRGGGAFLTTLLTTVLAGVVGRVISNTISPARKS